MRFFAAALILVVLFGCLGGGGTQPPANQTNQTNQSPPIQIIVGNQTNQTTVKNITEEQNNTPPPPPPPEIEYTNEPEKELGIYFIDVGAPGEQGDAVLIRKGDFTMLVDAGAADKGDKVTNFLRDHQVETIQVLISTNADPRHYGGIETVAQNIPVQQLWWSGLTENDPNYASVMQTVGNKTRKVRVINDGFSIVLDGINITALNPSGAGVNDVNNDAIVLRLADRNFTALLTSGIQTGTQGNLANNKASLIQTQVMQAPYYGVGAGTSNIGLFLITAKPKTIVISGSSDDSAANGGSRDPFKRLMNQYGIAWYENYVNGTIRVSSDGQNYTVMPLGAGQ